MFLVVARYVVNSVMQLSYGAVPEFYKLLPLATVLQGNDLNDELESVCSCLLAVLSNSLTLGKHVPELLDSLKVISECPFWSAREVVPEFMQVFVFHNMATIVSQPQWIEAIQSNVLHLLEDNQPEVRLKARHVLSDLLHCQLIRNPDQLLVSTTYNKNFNKLM